jgi:hypothetical protein
MPSETGTDVEDTLFAHCLCSAFILDNLPSRCGNHHRISLNRISLADITGTADLFSQIILILREVTHYSNIE